MGAVARKHIHFAVRGLTADVEYNNHFMVDGSWSQGCEFLRITCVLVWLFRKMVAISLYPFIILQQCIWIFSYVLVEHRCLCYVIFPFLCPQSCVDISVSCLCGFLVSPLLVLKFVCLCPGLSDRYFLSYFICYLSPLHCLWVSAVFPSVSIHLCTYGLSRPLFFAVSSLWTVLSIKALFFR